MNDLNSDIEWKISNASVPYEEAVAEMEARVALIRAGTAPEMIWLLEHPPLYTAGTSAKPADLIKDESGYAKFPVYETGRGGQYTYHGPGQRVAYVMLDLKKRQSTPDIKQYVSNLERWIINSLQQFDIVGERREGRVGIWVDIKSHQDKRNDATLINLMPKEAKIAAVGVRVRHWVTYHGISINVNPDLSHFNGIVPCGISDAGVTSLHDLGEKIDMSALDNALMRCSVF